MKESYYKYIPHLLTLTGLVIWGIAFGLSNYCNTNNNVVWIVFLLCQTVIYIIYASYARKLYVQANKDSLTRASNRRYFTSMISDLSKMKFPVSLMMIDIDNFKMINDVYGHLAGDEVLKQIAKILQNNTRTNDLFARWGGEEFTIVLPNTDNENALKIAEELRNIVENSNFDTGVSTVSITISIGIVTTTQPIPPNKFVKSADIALHKAKEMKNVVISYGQFL